MNTKILKNLDLLLIRNFSIGRQN